MRIRAVTNGDVIEVSDEAAKQLIDARIYEAVNEPADVPKAPKKKARTTK